MKRDDLSLNFPDGLFLTFLGLRLAHAIGWSWFFIFIPLAWSLITIAYRYHKAAKR